MERENNEFEECIEELGRIEKVILPQLDTLAEKIGEQYKAYADFARDAANLTARLGQFNAKTSSRISMAGLFLSRGFEGYGAMKAAREHNKRLDEMASIKQEMASEKLQHISGILPRVAKNLEKSKQLCNTYFNKTVKLKDLTPEMTDLMVTALNLYRSNLYFYDLGTWLEKEYGSWSRGETGCGEPIPTYLDANYQIGRLFYSGNLTEVFVRAAERTNEVTGREVAILADSQLAIVALDDYDGVAEIDPESANPKIAKLLEQNEGVKFYRSSVTELAESLNHNPVKWWNIICISIAVIYLGGMTSLFWVVKLGPLIVSTVVGEALILRVWRVIRNRIYVDFIKDVQKVTEEVNLQTRMLGGYVEHKQPDLTKKNVWAEGFRTLFRL